MSPHSITSQPTLLCGYCGYDLSGLCVNSRCPECGQRSWPAAATHELDNLAKKVQITGLVCIFSFFACLGPIAALLALPTFVLANRFRLQLADGHPASPTARSAVEVGVRCARITLMLSVILIASIALMMLVRG